MRCFARVVTWASTGCLVGSFATVLAGTVPSEPVTPHALVEPLPRIAIIIDDLGYLPVRGSRALQLPGAVSFAVLPYAPHSRRLATQAHENGKEVLLHLPMQSVVGDAHPGEGELTEDMTRERFMATLDRNLSSVPFVSGVNNHMGSLLTQSPDHMRWLMQRLAKNPELYFIDSRTTAETVAVDYALEQGVPVLSRDVFLDNEQDVDAIRAQFDYLISEARRKGSAIGIGHPHAETLIVLEQVLPQLQAWGVELVSASELISSIVERSAEPWQLSLSPSPKVAKN